MPQRNGSPAAHAPLSAEDARLASLLAEGKSTDDIARELSLTKNQLKRRLTALSERLGATRV